MTTFRKCSCGETIDRNQQRCKACHMVKMRAAKNAAMQRCDSCGHLVKLGTGQCPNCQEWAFTPV